MVFSSEKNEDIKLVINDTEIEKVRGLIYEISCDSLTIILR